MIKYSFSNYVGEETVYTVDWSTKVAGLSTSVSTAVWSVDSGTATISGENLSSSVASATLTTPAEGDSIIKIVATFADAQIDVFYFRLRVCEP